MTQRRHLLDGRRRRVGRREAVRRHDTVGGQRHARLLEQLTDRRRPRRLARVAEPPRRVLLVVRIDRPAGERDVAGQEPALPAALDHEHLGAGVAGTHAHDGGRASDRSLVHERHPRRSPPYCVRARRCCGSDPRRDPTRRSDHVREVHGARALRRGRLLRCPAGRTGRGLRDEPARASRVRHVRRAGARAVGRGDRRRSAPPDRGRRGRRDARTSAPRRDAGLSPTPPSR